MAVNDPIADMLTRIRNANLARHETTQIPASRMAHSIAQVLKREGFISEVKEEGEGIQRKLVLSLKYNEETRQPVIKKLKRISKPGLRVYANRGELPRVLGGIGVAIVSTSKGIMTAREARREGVGGEVLCYIW
ncbi:MAG: 30S ribosomal protein S8 [Synechococcales cyanobacterium RU_4_20]|nr:30S ribosomal protein S8 [Synechococcales cyanobacterium RU_4_20]